MVMEIVERVPITASFLIVSWDSYRAPQIQVLGNQGAGSSSRGFRAPPNRQPQASNFCLFVALLPARSDPVRQLPFASRVPLPSVLRVRGLTFP
jgi:hypothetical protein